MSLGLVENHRTEIDEKTNWRKIIKKYNKLMTNTKAITR